ncbi:MAG: hypothetical protein ACXABY_06345, partial [Candidatus Thorarchaeota archaeon]
MITPLRDNILIKILEPEQTSPIHMPNAVSNQAEVIAVGNGGYTETGLLIPP